MADLSWFRWEGTTLFLNLHAQPGARNNQFVGLHGNRLKIKIDAPPVDGRANEALIEFLSQQFQCKQSCIVIVQGALGRTKTVCIAQPGLIPQTLQTLGLVQT